MSVAESMRLLDDPDPGVREEALSHLAHTYPEPEGFRYEADQIRKAGPRAIELLGDEDLGVRSQSAHLLGWIATDHPGDVKKAIPEIIELLDAEDEAAREHAAWALNNVAKTYPQDVKKAAPRLIEALNKYSWTGSHFRELLEVLTEICPDDMKGAVPKLVDLLGSADPEKQAEAASVLARALKKFPVGAAYPEDFKRAAQKLTALLDSRHEEVRQHAVSAIAGLARLLPGEVKEIIPRLVALLDDKDGYTKLGAVGALEELGKDLPESDKVTGVLGKAIPKLLALLDGSGDLFDDHISEAAASALGKLAGKFPEYAKEAIRELMDRERAESLAEIAKTFPDEVEEEFANPLLLLNASGGGVREGFLDSLKGAAAKFPTKVRKAIPKEIDRALIPRVIEQLDDRSVDVKRNAIFCLEKLAKSFPDDVTPAIAKLKKLVDYPYEPLRRDARSAIEKLEKCLPPKIGPQSDAAEDPSVLRRQRNMRALVRTLVERREYGEIGPDDVTFVIELLDENAASWRAEAAHAIGLMRGAKLDKARAAVPQLIKLLEDETPKVRLDAAGALGHIAEEFPRDARPAAPKLIRLLELEKDQDKRLDITSSAAHALANIAKEFPDDVRPAVSMLMRLLNDQDPEEIGNAEQALGILAQALPEDVRAAVPKLIELLDYSPVKAFRGDTSGTLAKMHVEQETMHALANIADKFPQDLMPAASKLFEELSSSHVDNWTNAVRIFRQIGRRFPEGITKAVGILIGTYDFWDPATMEVYGPREQAERLIEGLAKEFPDLVRPWARELKKRHLRTPERAE